MVPASPVSKTWIITIVGLYLYLLYIMSYHHPVFGVVDLTLKKNAKGGDVVAAVLFKLDLIKFNQSSTENQFNKQRISLRGVQVWSDGGIWGINKTIFEQTQQCIYMTTQNFLKRSIASFTLPGPKWTTVNLKFLCIQESLQEYTCSI